jgi:hypothetical protein
VLTGLVAAIRARPAVFLGVAAAVVVLDLVLPPLVLSLARKPADFFTFNPWLRRLPEYLASPTVPLGQKLDFLPRLALFWFSADSPYGGTEWGYAVDGTDVVRFGLTGLLVGAYFALWLYRRDQLAGAGWGIRLGRPGGVAGAFASVLGFSTGPCSVMGCGAPVIPVVGLAFVGLSSGTLAFLHQLSRVGTAVVLAGLAIGVAGFAWRAGGGIGAVSPGWSSSPLRSRTPGAAAPRR